MQIIKCLDDTGPTETASSLFKGRPLCQRCNSKKAQASVTLGDKALPLCTDCMVELLEDYYDRAVGLEEALQKHRSGDIISTKHIYISKKSPDV